MSGIVEKGITQCRKGHSHWSTSWTIYAVDSSCSNETDTYGFSLNPVDVFDTKEQVNELYTLSSFAKPKGPPSCSMIVPGGAIAVFRGGKYGFPAVKPEWEDPAARDGGELRFIFNAQQDPFTVLDKALMSLVAWMTVHSAYKGAQLLGVFVKNTAHPDSRDIRIIQFRLWISKVVDGNITRMARIIGNDMAGVLAQAGARGVIIYRRLDNLIRLANVVTSADLQQFKSGRDSIRLKIFVPSRAPGTNGDCKKVK